MRVSPMPKRWRRGTRFDNHIERRAGRAAHAAPLKHIRPQIDTSRPGSHEPSPRPEGAEQVSPGQSEAAQPLRRPGLTVPPKFFALKGRDKHATSSESSVVAHNGEPLFPSIRSHRF
jgi:hypothetical protein